MSERDPRLRLRIGAPGPGPGAGGDRDPERAAIAMARIAIVATVVVGQLWALTVALNAYFETYRSGDEYDRNAITHVMACSSHFPGLLLRP